MIKPLLMLGLALILSSCAHPAANVRPAPGEPRVAARHGRVVRVNLPGEYVILECTFLPSAGEQITLRRDNRVVSQVRIGAYSSGHFVSADIVEGIPMAGDWFYLETIGLH